MSRYYTRAAVNRGIRAGVVVAGLGLGSWYVLNSGNPKWLFSPTLKAACFVQEPVTGIRIRFDTVRGSLGSGKLDFSGLEVAWKKKGWIPQKAECDLHFERMAVDVGAANADMLLRVHYEGLRFDEVPVVMKGGPPGRSMHRGLRPVYYVYKLLLAMGLARLGRGAH